MNYAYHKLNEKRIENQTPKPNFFAFIFLLYMILSLSVFLVHTTKTTNYQIEYGNYVVIGKTYGSIESSLFEEVARLYSEYFNATIIQDIPDNLVENLIIIAHGTNDGSSIYFDLNNSRSLKDNRFVEIEAENAIYMSCSIGIIRQVDSDTNHFAYSIINETDVYSGSYRETEDGILIDWNIEGWSVYFLELIKTGMDWFEAEILARDMVNEWRDQI